MKKMNLVKLMAVAFVVMSIASNAYAAPVKDKDVNKAKHEYKNKKHAVVNAVPAVPVKKGY